MTIQGVCSRLELTVRYVLVYTVFGVLLLNKLFTSNAFLR